MYNDVLDEIEQRRLGPMDVLKHEEKRSLLRQRLEQFAVGPEGFLCALRLFGIGGSGGPLWKAAEDLLQGPERNALTVGEAASLKDRRALACLSD